MIKKRDEIPAEATWKLEDMVEDGKRGRSCMKKRSGKQTAIRSLREHWDGRRIGFLRGFHLMILFHRK